MRLCKNRFKRRGRMYVPDLLNLVLSPRCSSKTMFTFMCLKAPSQKMGHSAGIAITTSIVSILTGIPVSCSVAMTGEVSLRGRVLPIGGLKEKLLAALRGGLKTVLIPSDNEKDLAEIPNNVKKGLKIIPVSTVDEVLKLALTKPLTAIEWGEVDGVEAVSGWRYSKRE